MDKRRFNATSGIHSANGFTDAATRRNQSYNQSSLFWRSKQELASWVATLFNGKAYFLTLTFNPRHSNRLQCERDFNHYIRRLGKKVYGQAFVKRTKRLEGAYCFEFSYNENTHVHMLIMEPTNADRLFEPFDQLAINTWLELSHAGTRAAQDARLVFSMEGLLEYMLKQVRNDESQDNFKLL